MNPKVLEERCAINDEMHMQATWARAMTTNDKSQPDA
jgi:hypothetical protein